VSTKKSLLFLTTELPWPADSGGKIKSFRLIKFLAEHYEVRVLCAYGEERPKDLAELRERSGVASVQAFNNHKPRTAFNFFMALISFPTFNAFRVYSKSIESMMKWGIESSDVVIIDHLEMMEMIPAKMVPKVIYHSHNAEFKLWEDFAQFELNPIKKLSIQLEANRVKAFERWVIRKSKFTFASPNDAVYLSDNMDVPREKLKNTLHLGDENLLKLGPVNIASNGPVLFFGATLSWMPNRDGLVWFIRNCWKYILMRVPNAELNVCGRGADGSLMSLMRQTDGIQYLGFVDDLAAEMGKAALAIVPLRFGSGMKIKTLDAMSRGLPIVSTTSGVEGLTVEHGNHVRIANNEIEFAEHIIYLLENRVEASNQALSARSLVSEYYTYPAIFKEMLDDLQAN